MKRILLALLVCALIATTTWANPTLDGVSPHLGWWAPGAAGSTHQYWDFTVNVYLDGGPYEYWADPPTEMVNPSVAKAFISGAYDGSTLFNADPTDGIIQVLLEIENFPVTTYHKELWVDIGFTGTLTDVSASGTGGGLTYTTIPLGTGGPSGEAEFGFEIIPNPWKEDIFFTIEADGAILPSLDWIHVDTICIPAPGAIALGGIGVVLVGWLRRKRTL